MSHGKCDVHCRCTGRSSEDKAWQQNARRNVQPTMLQNDAIVSLSPQGTEILFALGLGGRVVGVTDMCDWPPEASQLHLVSRCRIDSSKFTSAEVEEKLQALKSEVRDNHFLFKTYFQECGRMAH